MNRKISKVLLFAMFLNMFIPQILLADNMYKDYEKISDWAVDYVVEATDKDIVSGYDGYFNPKKNITRAEFTKLIVEMLGLERGQESITFSDVKKNQWFYDYVIKGASNNIIKGSNGKFNPNGNITREEMAAIISRSLELDEYGDVELKDFKDVSSWAIEDVNRVMDRGLMSGFEGKFNPRGRATREMAAVVIMRAYDYKKDTNPEESPGEIVENKDIKKSLDNLVSYVESNVKDPTVSTIGGEWSVIGLNRSNRKIGKDFNEKYIKNLKEKLKASNGELHRTRYTEYSRVLLALNSMGLDAKDLTGYNLEEKILNMDNITKQGINGPIFALIALNSKDSSMNMEKKAMVDYILEREIRSGGWALSSDIEKGDVDVTAMVIQALAPFKDDREISEALERGVEFLSKEQENDGGYTSWGSKNSENVSQVIMGLTSLGIDPHEDERFVKKGNSLVDFLLTYQDKSGGFKHEVNGDTNLMATEQGLLALVSYERLINKDASLYDMSK